MLLWGFSLSRAVVEENVFQRKKREIQEEAGEKEEKKRWEVFKANHKQQHKRRREQEVVPEGWKTGQNNKRLRRMSWESEVLDLAGCLRLAEEMCLRAGKLRRRICLDQARVLRKMETYSMDRIISETPAWWNMAMAWTGTYSSLMEEEEHPFDDETSTLVMAKPSSDFGIVRNHSENGFPRTLSRETLLLSSPIKKQRTGFRTKLLFWKQRDNPGDSYLAGQSGGFICDMKETIEMAGAGEKAE